MPVLDLGVKEAVLVAHKLSNLGSLGFVAKEYVLG
jgi:hypothetical protein